MSEDKNERIRLIVRRFIREVLREENLLKEQDEMLDLSGIVKVRMRERLEKLAEDLNKKISEKLFGRRVILSGTKPDGEKLKNVKGVVSEVSFKVTDSLKIQGKVELEEAGYTILNPTEVKIIDTMGTNRRSSNYYL